MNSDTNIAPGRRFASNLRMLVIPRIRFHGLLWGFLLALCVGSVPHSATAQQGGEPQEESFPAVADISGNRPFVGQQASDHTAEEQAAIYFSFDRAPWREVIHWIADECNLALHYEDLPTGSFSYSDPGSFTRQGAIDRLNLFLLPQGYTLVQSRNLLSVINLADPRSMQTLDVLAPFVKVDDLPKLDEHDVVKCIFPLGELDVDDALDELSVLNLMKTPSPLNKTNQLLLTDTVSQLQKVKAILDAFQPSTLDNGTVMKNFALRHVDAEDILSVARPHLGLATGETIGIDVSISTDLQGKNIFVTGVEDKVKLIEGLVSDLDVPQNVLSAAGSEATLQSHLVEGGNVEMVYNVLQTLLAGKQARISMDEDASSIVALASPDIQYEIQETVRQLQATEPDFEIIQLKHVDPYFVISLLDEMLDLPSAYDDPDDVDPDAPSIDADPGNMRLFVRAKRHRIEQIKKIVTGLDVGTTSNQERIRLVPLRGSQAERVLEVSARFWRRENPIVLYPDSLEEEQSTERAIHEAPARSKLTSAPMLRNDLAPRMLTDNITSQAAPVRCQVTPRGLLLQCDDSEALDQLVEDLKVISGPAAASISPPIVFYLKYVKPEDALRMLSELLDGGENAKEAEAGTLVNGYVSSSGNFVSSILTSRDGLLTMIAGTITVVADSRLNRLIAQGTAEDIDRIEDYLRIIDKDKGLTSVETYGTSHVIELLYTDANQMASAIREAYAGRVAGGPSRAPSSPAGGAGGGNPEQPSERDGKSSDKESSGKEGKTANNGKPGSAQPAVALEPMMTIAVHEPSNSIIVTAPDQLFQQVHELVQTIDSNSQQTVEILAPSNAGLLQAMFGEGGSTRPSPGGSENSRSSGGSRSEGVERLQSMLREKIGR